MKQHITIEQLNELSKKGRRKYLIFWLNSTGIVRTKLDINYVDMFDYLLNSTTLLSIGQMIEYLGEHKITQLNLEPNEYILKWTKDKSLCDTCWEKVKEDLER